MTKTVTVQIGNTDDKLAQADWSAYAMAIKGAIFGSCTEVHFFGGPPTFERWQNVAWVVTVEDDKLADLRRALTDVRQCFEQESVALTPGVTEFI